MGYDVISDKGLIVNISDKIIEDFNQKFENLEIAKSNFITILKEMVKQGLAKRIFDIDNLNPIIINGDKYWLDQIRYYDFQEDIEFWGIDEEGIEEVKEIADEEGYDFEAVVDDYLDIIVFPPGQGIQWWFE
jgi:hypothetical protein